MRERVSKKSIAPAPAVDLIRLCVARREAATCIVSYGAVAELIKGFEELARR